MTTDDDYIAAEQVLDHMLSHWKDSNNGKDWT